MQVMKFQQNQQIAKKNDKVTCWYFIQEGSVIQRSGFSEVTLTKNAIIGIMDKDIFLCDYTAAEDTVLAAFVCQNSADLKALLKRHEKIRNVFLKSTLEQRHHMLTLYSDLNKKAKRYHRFVEEMYSKYKNYCNTYKIDVEHFTRISNFNLLSMKHKAELWEINNSDCIINNYIQDYVSLMSRDDALTVGVIMEASAQMHRFMLGIGEMEAYISQNKDILLSENHNDLFTLFFNLSVKTYAKKYDIEPITKDINEIAAFAEELGLYSKKMLAYRLSEFNNYDYNATEGGDSPSTARTEIDICSEDCFYRILAYGGYDNDTIEELYEQLISYHNHPEKNSNDKHVHALRKSISKTFYEVYYNVFVRAIKDESTLTPDLMMFLNFGFMDTSLIGEENALALYDLTAHIDICHSNHIYTIYEWLKAIYKGDKDPSKNEFDMDYKAHVADLQKRRTITAEEAEDYLYDRDKKVAFEIENMFTSVNKQTYGRITTFCPVLSSDDLLSTIDKMLVTSEKLENAMNAIRKTDYSVFYREVMFSDVSKGINCERIMKEVLPEIILMPNAGNRGILWQETAGIKSDTPARFMFPIFTMSDVDEMMLKVMGAFRWEMCRKIQGIHWNDVTDKSLTAEYCAYLQFYRKNNELSADSKEKIKNALARSKNSYREVFIRDYANWVIFESKGSFRLNKIVRDILVRYCPFASVIRNELKVNPVYQTSITKFENQTAKSLRHHQTVYDKYVKADGEFTKELEDNILFLQM